MKKVICLLITAVLIMSTITLTSCGEDNSKNTKSTTKVTSQTSATEDKTLKDTDSESEIKDYLDSFLAGKSKVLGAWKVQGFDYMTILFRNDNLAEMAMGTEGYFSKYSFNTDNKTLGVQLMPSVIDGVYSYKFSDNNNKLTLTLDDNTLVLVKQNDFSLVPEAPKKPKIDKELLGWWENENGGIYCFQDNGVMYENNTTMETCYTYTVEDGKIKATYSYGGEMDDEFNYEFKKGKLTINDLKCEKKK